MGRGHPPKSGDEYGKEEEEEAHARPPPDVNR